MSKADASGNHHNRRILERGRPNIDPVLRIGSPADPQKLLDRRVHGRQCTRNSLRDLLSMNWLELYICNGAEGQIVVRYDCDRIAHVGSAN